MILTKKNIAQVDLEKLVYQKIDSSRIDELLLIVPTNRRARTQKKELLSSLPLKSASVINIETLGTISTKILSESKSFKQLSEAAATVFIKQSAAQLKLNYFSMYKDGIPFGTLDRIKNVISEYKRHGITSNHLRKEAEKLDKSEKLKALDIAAVYEKYLEKCLSLNAFELGDVYGELNHLSAAQFSADFKKLYPSTNLIVVNGFDEFSILEIKIIDSLSKVVENLFIDFDYNENNKFIFSHLDKCYERFLELGFRITEDSGEEKRDSFKKLIRNNLFKTKKHAGKKNHNGKIFKLAGYDREKEVELIAKEIKRLIIEEKVEPHKICVAFNLIQNYSPIVRDLFRKNGLPFNLTDRIPLDNSNPVTAVVNFLEIAENDFYYKNIFRAVTSGFIYAGDIDYSNLYKTAAELKLVSGKENWIAALEDSIRNLKNVSDEDEETAERKSASYKKALRDIKNLSALLQPFEKKHSGGKAELTIKEFTEKFSEFIYSSQLPFKLLQIKENSEENIRGFTEFLETVNEVFELLEEEYGSEKKYDLKFFMEQIRTICGWARFNVKEKSNYGVQITAFEEIRGLQFDYLFLGGLCEGDIPTRYKPEIFFSGSFRKQALVHQTEERSRFYQILCAWNKRLYLSYPQTQGGRETVVSTFLNDFEELFEINLIDENNFNGTVFSGEEAEIFIGENLAKGKVNTVKILDQLKIENDLNKAVEIEKLREEDSFASSSYNGILLANLEKEKIDPAVLEKLASLKNKQYSISQLETYAKCPFKFFTERVLGIETFEEPTEDIEAVEMGRILHAVLFEFYTLVRDSKIQIAGCTEEEFKKLQKMIFDIAEKQTESEQTGFKSPLTFYEKEKIFGIGGSKEESVLNRFIENERNGGDEFIPQYFEVSFGRLRKEGADEILSGQEPVEIDGVKLRGKIDRVEISKENELFNIVDYKLSGKKPTFRELKEGISLQLPVYLYAAQKLLTKKSGKDIFPNEMIIYSLKYALDDFGKNPVSIKYARDEEIKTIEQLIDKTISHITNYIRQISEGKFGLSPHTDREKLICSYCQFKSVCRVEESAG